jgi:hypothetical protein
MAFKIHMEEGKFKAEICEAVEQAIDDRLQEIISETAEELTLTAAKVVEAYHDDPTVREALHEEIDVAELVEENELTVDDVFSQADITQYVCENLKPRDCFTLEDLAHDVKKSDRLDRDDVKEIIEVLDLSPLDLFDKADLIAAAGTTVRKFKFEDFMELKTEDLVAIWDIREDFREVVLRGIDRQCDDFVAERKWHAGDLFTKVDLAMALLDYEDNVTAEAAASTFLGTLRGDFGDKYIEAFVAHLWQITFADNVPTPKLAPPPKPDVTNGKAELKAILAKLLMALE